MPGSLNQYLQQTMRLMRDSRQTLLNPSDLVTYINIARREVAMRTQCIRRLPPISGGIDAISVTNPGSGYTNPTVTITSPDFPSGQLPFPQGDQATAQATQIGGQIQGVNIINGGAGYFEPAVIINDPTGTGATAVADIPGLSLLNQGQEVYPFSDFNLAPFPGVESVLAVRGVSIIYSDYRYSIPIYSFSVYQARVRSFPSQYQWVPAIGSQFGQGVDGSFYLYPLPSQTYQAEFDCLCLPSDLNTNYDVEAIPDPWTDGVSFLAAYYAAMELQNFNSARFFQDQFNQFMTRYSSYSRLSRAINSTGSRW